MKTAICAIIKNEHKYLKEWLDYHFSIGFNEVYLYEDYGSLSHSAITSEYENVHLDKYDEEMMKEEKKIIEFGSYRQKILFEWFIDKHKIDIDWTLFIDVDEYLTFEGDYDLDWFFDRYSEYSAIRLMCKTYNAGGHIYYDNAPTFMKYTDLSYFREDCKIFVNMKHLIPFFNAPHDCPFATNTDFTGFASTKSYDFAYLRHYTTRSWEEWCEKVLQRGSVMYGKQNIEDFFLYNPDMLDKMDELYALLDGWKADRYSDQDVFYIRDNADASEIDSLQILFSALYYARKYNKYVKIPTAWNSRYGEMFVEYVSRYDTYDTLDESLPVYNCEEGISEYVVGNAILEGKTEDTDKMFAGYYPDFESFKERYFPQFTCVDDMTEEEEEIFEEKNPICNVFTLFSYENANTNKDDYVSNIHPDCIRKTVVLGDDEELFNSVFGGDVDFTFKRAESIYEAFYMFYNTPRSLTVVNNGIVSKLSEVFKRGNYMVTGNYFKKV